MAGINPLQGLSHTANRPAAGLEASRGGRPQSECLRPRPLTTGPSPPCQGPPPASRAIERPCREGPARSQTRQWPRRSRSLRPKSRAVTKIPSRGPGVDGPTGPRARGRAGSPGRKQPPGGRQRDCRCAMDPPPAAGDAPRSVPPGFAQPWQARATAQRSPPRLPAASRRRISSWPGEPSPPPGQPLQSNHQSRPLGGPRPQAAGETSGHKIAARPPLFT